jgi:hypothetical protein
LTTTRNNVRFPRSFSAVARRTVLGASAIAVCGCGSPSAANIELRKKNQDLESRVASLEARHARDTQTIAAAESSRPTVPTLPPDRLANLFTTHGLQFTDATAGDNPDPTSATDSELKLVLETVDQDGTPIKPAGSFSVEAFDLDDPAHPSIGRWNFSADQSRKLFFSRFGLYGYVLTCPWQTVPAHPNLTVKVSFTDTLTGMTFVAQQQVKIRPPVAAPR